MFRFGKETLCQKIQGMLSEYVDNRLDSEKRSLVERHLAACEACSKELESLRMTVQLLHRVPDVSVPRAFTITVPEPRREGALGPSTSLRWLRPATAVATIVLLVLLVGDFLNVFGHEAGTRGGGFLNTPPGQTTIFSGVQDEGNLTDTGGNLTGKSTVSPTPEGAGNVTEGNASIGAGYTASGTQGEAGPPSLDGQPPVRWPLRQIEIAMGAVVFSLVVMTLFALRQRRKPMSIKLK